MKTITYRTVSESIWAQMTENTGRHMLDSGGAYGRRWERFAGMTVEDFDNLPAVTVDPDYGHVSVSLFHVLKEHLRVNADTVELTRLFRDYVDNTPEGEAYYNGYNTVLEWLDSIRADNVRTDNTYNYETLADGVVQYAEFSLGIDQYVALSTHNGADVRGGYSDYVIYRACDCWLYAMTECTVFCRMHNGYFRVSSGDGVTDDTGTPVDLGPRGLATCPVCKWPEIVGDTIGECYG